MKRLLFLITLLAVSLTLPAQTNKNIRKLQGERTQLQKKISQSEQLLRSTKRDVRTQMNNLALLNAQIGEQQKYVDGIRSEVSALNVEIAAMQKQLRALRDDLDRCKRSYRRSVNYMFRNRMAYNKLVFIFSAKDFRQMYRRLRYVRDYSKFQRAQGELIARKEAELRKKEQALLEASKEREARAIAEQKLSEAKPKLGYVDKILESKKTILTTHLATDYGCSAVAFNRMLCDKKIQRKLRDTYVLYSQYQGHGWTHTFARAIKTNHGREIREQMEWTQKGNIGLYELLKDRFGLLPEIERDYSKPYKIVTTKGKIEEVA